MPTSIKFLIFATGWMVFRAVGSGLFLSLGILESPRAAPPDWTIAFLGDFAIGTTALFLAYMIWKKPSAFLWGILLEIGINEISIRTILSLNTFIQSVALIVMFRPQVKAYFRV